MEYNFPVTRTTHPKPRPADETKLGFAKYFTDHMFVMDYDEGQGWHDGRVVPHEPFLIEPASCVLHYAQMMFEGMKAYRTPDGGVQIFRPDMNIKRMARTNERMCIPELPGDLFLAAVKAAGGRAIPLKVRGGFHSPFMAEAATSFAADLAAAKLNAPAIPVYANRTAQPYGADVAGMLAGQIDHPVLWEDSVRAMIAAGTDTFLELGPGRTLCGLIAKTDASVRTFAAEKAEDFEKLMQEVTPC